MHFTTLAATALAVVGVQAQNKGGQIKTVSVIVGKNGTVFQPNNIRAAVGEAVQFQFMGGNHTVTQSTFDQPCQPINEFNKNVTGVHSGFVPFAASAAMGQVPVYTIMINNTTPMWLYCAQAKHCQNGMVMVINENTSANASRSLANYRKLASSVAQSSFPGGATTGGGSTGGGSGTGTGTGGGSGSGSGSGTGTSGGSGGSTTGGSGGAATTTPASPAAGSMLSAPGALSLLAIAGSLLLL